MLKTRSSPSLQGVFTLPTFSLSSAPPDEKSGSNKTQKETHTAELPTVVETGMKPLSLKARASCWQRNSGQSPLIGAKRKVSSNNYSMSI